MRCGPNRLRSATSIMFPSKAMTTTVLLAMGRLPRGHHRTVSRCEPSTRRQGRHKTGMDLPWLRPPPTCSCGKLVAPDGWTDCLALTWPAGSDDEEASLTVPTGLTPREPRECGGLGVPRGQANPIGIPRQIPALFRMQPIRCEAAEYWRAGQAHNARSPFLPLLAEFEADQLLPGRLYFCRRTCGRLRRPGRM
jgi:hypothetical protein